MENKGVNDENLTKREIENAETAESMLSDSNAGNNKSSPSRASSSRRSTGSRHSSKSRKNSLRSSELLSMFTRNEERFARMEERSTRMEKRNEKFEERLIGYIQSMEARSNVNFSQIRTEMTEFGTDIVSMKTQDIMYEHNNDRVV